MGITTKEKENKSKIYANQRRHWGKDYSVKEKAYFIKSITFIQW